MTKNEREKLRRVYQDLRMVRIRMAETAERHPRIAKESDFSDGYAWCLSSLDGLGEVLGMNHHRNDGGYDVFFPGINDN